MTLRLAGLLSVPCRVFHIELLASLLLASAGLRAQVTAPMLGPLAPATTPVTITIARLPPVLRKISYSNTGTGSTVTVTGYSTTRDMISGAFTFMSASRSPATVTAPLTSAFTSWYQNEASSALGGQFKLTLPLTVPDGTTSVSVTLTNSVGTSPPASTP